MSGIGPPRRATWPRWADANGRIGRVNRWNACGKEALRSAKELSQRPAPQVKFPAESPRRLDEERLPVRWRRIYDAPIAVGKTAAIVTEKTNEAQCA